MSAWVGPDELGCLSARRAPPLQEFQGLGEVWAGDLTGLPPHGGVGGEVTHRAVQELVGGRRTASGSRIEFVDLPGEAPGLLAGGTHSPQVVGRSSVVMIIGAVATNHVGILVPRGWFSSVGPTAPAGVPMLLGAGEAAGFAR